MKLDLSLVKRQGDFTFDAAFAAEGKRIGIFGPSGSGKTTLMHMIAGLVRPCKGQIVLDDEVLFDGGIQRGSDVLKAIALGATACLIGKAHLWGMACGGEAGECPGGDGSSQTVGSALCRRS